MKLKPLKTVRLGGATVYFPPFSSQKRWFLGANFPIVRLSIFCKHSLHVYSMILHQARILMWCRKGMMQVSRHGSLTKSRLSPDTKTRKSITGCLNVYLIYPKSTFNVSRSPILEFTGKWDYENFLNWIHLSFSNGLFCCKPQTATLAWNLCMKNGSSLWFMLWNLNLALIVFKGWSSSISRDSLFSLEDQGLLASHPTAGIWKCVLLWCISLTPPNQIFYCCPLQKFRWKLAWLSTLHLSDVKQSAVKSS